VRARGGPPNDRKDQPRRREAPLSLVSATHIKVLELELLEGVVEGGRDVLGVVLVVPELGGDEDVLAAQAGDVDEGALDALADLALVLVDLGEVEVAVARLEGLVDAVADLARRSRSGASCGPRGG